MTEDQLVTVAASITAAFVTRNPEKDLMKVEDGAIRCFYRLFDKLKAEDAKR